MDGSNGIEGEKTDKNAKMLFYIAVLSKDSSIQEEAKHINQIIHKTFSEMYKS